MATNRRSRSRSYNEAITDSTAVRYAAVIVAALTLGWVIYVYLTNGCLIPGTSLCRCEQCDIKGVAFDVYIDRTGSVGTDPNGYNREAQNLSAQWHRGDVITFRLVGSRSWLAPSFEGAPRPFKASYTIDACDPNDPVQDPTVTKACDERINAGMAEAREALAFLLTAPNPYPEQKKPQTSDIFGAFSGPISSPDNLLRKNELVIFSDGKESLADVNAKDHSGAPYYIDLEDDQCGQRKASALDGPDGVEGVIKRAYLAAQETAILPMIRENLHKYDVIIFVLPTGNSGKCNTPDLLHNFWLGSLRKWAGAEIPSFEFGQMISGNKWRAQ